MHAQPTLVLITGAGGFVERHLVAELERETDWELVGLGLRPASFGIRLRMLACDLLDYELLTRTLAYYRPNVIFHLAAQSYVPKAIAAPGETLMNNTLGQINMLEACRALDLNPII